MYNIVMHQRDRLHLNTRTFHICVVGVEIKINMANLLKLKGETQLVSNAPPPPLLPPVLPPLSPAVRYFTILYLLPQEANNVDVMCSVFMTTKKTDHDNPDRLPPPPLAPLLALDLILPPPFILFHLIFPSPAIIYY